MKYDLRKIMKSAWAMHRRYSCRALTFSDCLRRAWANEKAAMADVAESSRVAGKQYEDGMKISFEGYTCTLRRWTKGDHDRIYLNGCCRKGCGYVDLKSKTDCTIATSWTQKMATAILSMQF